MSERPEHNPDNPECQCFKCHIDTVGFGTVPGGANDTRLADPDKNGVKTAPAPRS